MAARNSGTQLLTMPLRKRPLGTNWLRIHALRHLGLESFHARLVAICSSHFRSHLERPHAHRDCKAAASHRLGRLLLLGGHLRCLNQAENFAVPAADVMLRLCFKPFPHCRGNAEKNPVYSLFLMSHFAPLLIATNYREAISERDSHSSRFFYGWA